jgi:D-glucosaminate-6-phosphate ammonia-lyase
MSTRTEAARKSVYAELNITPVINASGIYTDLGGSCLSPAVWAAATEANRTWVSMPELLDRSGEAIAELIGVEAARVVPGASAALALAVGACMTGGDGGLMEQLPNPRGGRSHLVIQAGHRYKYARCALIAGATPREAGTLEGTSESDLAAALGPDVACVLHPAHLDARSVTLPLEQVAGVAHAAGIPVVVDAAYMSFPVALIASYARRGADLACFSAKYFWGPNAGGFVYGRKQLIDLVREIDFTGYESGEYLVFGRAFKMDRATVVSTVMALREWMSMDHEDRWNGYRRRAERIAERLTGKAPGRFWPGGFTLDERIVAEPVNAVLVQPTTGSRLTVAMLEERLMSRSPSIRAVAAGDVLSLCLETVSVEEDDILVDGVAEALGDPAASSVG